MSGFRAIAAGGALLASAGCTPNRAPPTPEKEAAIHGGPTMVQRAPRPRPAGATVAVNYGRDIGWSGSFALEVQRDGESSLFTTFNDGTPEVGSWRAPVPRQTFDELVARLHASGYDHLPTDAADVPPGTKILTVGERLEGEPSPVVYPFVAVPPALVPVLAVLDDIKKQVRAHPVRVLRGSAAWSNGDVSHGAEAVVDVTLSNVGDEPLAMSNPLHDFATPRSDRGGWSGLRLVFQAKGEGEKQYDLVAADIHPSPDAVRGETCTLKPGESLRFEVRKKLDLRRGQYESRLEYTNMITLDDDPTFVGGTLWLEPGPLAAQGGPWWKVW
jgi:hypothetical protein